MTCGNNVVVEWHCSDAIGGVGQGSGVDPGLVAVHQQLGGGEVGVGGGGVAPRHQVHLPHLRWSYHRTGASNEGSQYSGILRDCEIFANLRLKL